MAIPNTTPTPNIIFNGLMAKMTDTEFRIVMVVVRATLGWEIDHKTGMRKKEDWISYSQLKRRTGRGYTALAKAINSCIRNGWIEARDREGNLLDTKNKRIGKRVFYRLGKEILLKNDGNEILVKEYKPLRKVKRLTPTSSESEISESEISESEAYKRKTYTKEKHIQKSNNSESKDSPPPKRKNFKVPSFTYKEITDAYQKYKGIELRGAEFGEVKRAIKTMLYSGRTKENIIDFMRFCADVCERMKEDEALAKKYRWLENWTILTIKRKMPEFLAGKLDFETEDIEIPSYAKDWQK